MSRVKKELGRVAADLRGHLEWMRENGVRELPAPPRRKAAAAVPAGKAAVGAGAPIRSLRDSLRAAVGQPARPAVGASSGARPATAAPASPAVPASTTAPPPSTGPRRTLEQIRAEIGDCHRCKLAGGRTKLVFGVGNPRAELVFVGEGPGEDEDLQGLPFVGKAGQLLTKMIEAMGYARDQVYICNVVKCRPPGNRNPEPDEIAACEPFLRAQLASIEPKVIVALGKFASQTLLRDQTAITKLRGHWREYCGIKLMPTFHPAYLLRNPPEKKTVWADLQQVMAVLGR